MRPPPRVDLEVVHARLLAVFADSVLAQTQLESRPHVQLRLGEQDLERPLHAPLLVRGRADAPVRLVEHGDDHVQHQHGHEHGKHQPEKRVRRFDV